MNAEDRRHRARVLVVAQRAEALGTVERPGALPPVRVSDIFAALGAVTTTEDPFDVVVLDHAAVDGQARRAADALRRLDPALRVVLLTDEPDRAKACDEAFDACLRLPDDLGLLETFLRREGPAETTPMPMPEAAAAPGRAASRPESAPPRARRAPEPARPAHAPQRQEPAPPPRRAEPPASSRAAKRPADRRPTPMPERSTSPPPPDTELGDVDLVERLLRQGPGLLDTALRLVVQQTGWTDVRLGSDADAEPSGAPTAQAEVRDEGHRFGWLRSNLTTREAIEPWARWLGRWLALERSYRDYRLMAYQDDLTGAWNRRFFNAFLTEKLDEARRLRRPVTVMVFDIDNFKLYNDSFGHQAGDTVLVETVRLLTSVIRKGDRVCRMGGDEFAVIFADLEGPREAGSTHPATPEHIAQRFQDQICRMRFPKLGAEAPGNLSISAGLATFPWDGLTPQELADCADRRALQSKQRGKNAITLGPGAR